MIRVLTFVVVLSTAIFADVNRLKLISGATVGQGISMFLSDIEIEKRLIAQTTAYVRFGGASYNVPNLNSGSVTAEVTHIAIGGRVNFNSIYLGLGYEHSFLELQNTATRELAEGSFSGPIIEMGKEFNFYPIVTSISVGMQFANIDFGFDSSEFDTGDLSIGRSFLTKLECSIGYLF